MADTPTDGTPDATASKPAPRRRTRSAGATSATLPVAKKRRGPGKKNVAAAAATAPAKTVAPVKAVRAAKPKTRAAAKPRTASKPAPAKAKGRGKLIAGGIAAAIGIAGAIAATLGRKKIATVTGDVMGVDAPKEPETPTTLDAPSHSPVPPVS